MTFVYQKKPVVEDTLATHWDLLDLDERFLEDFNPTVKLGDV